MESFDSERALEELEKLREQIVQARAERSRVDAAFDAFTSGFDVNRPPAVSVRPSLAGGDARSPSDSPAVVPTAASALPDTVPAVSQAIDAPVRRRRNPRVLGLVGIGAGVGVAIAAATLVVRGRQSAPQIAVADRTAANPTETARTPAAPAASVAAPPPQSAVAAAGVNVEIITRRRVWLRVIVDGKRAFEREVPAEQRIPLQAERSIMIRAGDAGAVAVVWNGRDAGPLGRDGIAITRQFTSDAK